MRGGRIGGGREKERRGKESVARFSRKFGTCLEGFSGSQVSREIRCRKLLRGTSNDNNNKTVKSRARSFGERVDAYARAANNKSSSPAKHTGNYYPVIRLYCRYGNVGDFVF